MLFVGRAAEIDSLRNLVVASQAGAGGAALIEGEAGLGKTRLLEELAAATTSSRVVWGRAWEEPGAPPYWPWRQALQSLPVTVDWDAARSAPSVATEVLDGLRRASLTQPVVVLLDDLHAADPDSIRLASFVARSIGELPVALVSAARPSTQLSSVARASMFVRLKPLDAVPAGELIAASAPITLDQGRRRALIEVAEGNPLVAIEVARLAGQDGRPPREIRAIVHDRLDPLPAPVRATLAAAAVLGRSFDVDRLAVMLSTSPLTVLSDLEPAMSLDVIVPAGTDSWRFSHQIVRDVVYDEMNTVRRIELHAAAAAAIAAEASDSTLGELARHLAAAIPIVDRATALDATLRAAEYAESSGAHADAADIFRHATDLVASDDARLDILLRLGQASLDAGQVAQACEAFDQAIGLSRSVGSADAFAVAALGRTERLRSDSFAMGWLPTVDAARRLLGDAPSALGSRLLARRALILGEAGMPGAHALAEQAAAEARLIGDLAALCECLSVLHLTCLLPELIERAGPVADELVEVAERTRNIERQLEGTLAQLTTRLTVGDLAGADEALQRCETLAAASGHPRHQFFALSRRAMRLFLAGKLSEGDDLLNRARELGNRIEEPDTDAVHHAARTVVLRDLVGEEELRTMLDEAVVMVEDGGDDRLCHYVAYVSAANGDLDRARELLDRALAVGDIEWVTQQIGWPFWACLIADTVVALSDRELAQQLYAALTGCEHLVAVNAGAISATTSAPDCSADTNPQHPGADPRPADEHPDARRPVRSQPLAERFSATFPAGSWRSSSARSTTIRRSAAGSLGSRPDSSRTRRKRFRTVLGWQCNAAAVARSAPPCSIQLSITSRHVGDDVSSSP